MARVHVAGNAALDVVVPSLGDAAPAQDGWGANVEILHDPVQGTLGGCGAAPAYVLAHLGHQVTLTSNLGDDSFGTLLAGWLHDAGVRLEPSPVCGRASSVHVINVHGSARRSAYYRGTRVEWTVPKETPDWYIAAGYGAVDADDITQLLDVFTAVRARGSKVLFDPSPWFAGRVEADAMRQLWTQVDVLSATADELTPWLPKCTEAADLARAAAEIAGLAVVKQGLDGACWSTEDASGQACTQAVDGNSTGAGDSFNASLVDGLARGVDVETSVRQAVARATDLVRAGKGVLGLFPPDRA